MPPAWATASPQAGDVSRYAARAAVRINATLCYI